MVLAYSNILHVQPLILTVLLGSLNIPATQGCAQSAAALMRKWNIYSLYQCDEATRGATGLYLYLAFWQRTVLTIWRCYSILRHICTYILLVFWSKIKIATSRTKLFWENTTPETTIFFNTFPCSYLSIYHNTDSVVHSGVPGI